MKKWSEHKLGDFAEIQNGFAFKSKDLGEKGVPVIKIKNIKPPNILIDDASCYIGLVDEKLSKYYVEKDDFLISMTGSTVNVMSSAVGKMGVYRLPEKSLLNQRVGKIYVIDEKVSDSKYLQHFLNRYEIHYLLALNATGSANQANISPAQIKNLDVLLPPLPEQKAIASILSALDDKIELNLQMNKTLEEMAMALYKHWFVDFGPFQDGKFVESELGMIPEGWEVKRLDESFDVKIGRTPPRKEKYWFSTKEGVKWASIKDMGKSNCYINKTSEYLTNEAVKSKNVALIPPDTVLLSFKLTVGRVSITSDTMTTNEAIAHFHTNDSTIIPTEQLYLYLKQFKYNNLASTSSIATAVNSKTVKAIKILIPSKKEIDKFFNLIKIKFSLIKINSQEIESLTKLRDTLLHKLISGEVRLKEFQKTIEEAL